MKRYRSDGTLEEIPEPGAITIAGKAALVWSAKFSEDQPRDANGEWLGVGSDRGKVKDYGSGKVFVGGVGTQLHEQMNREVARAGDDHARQIFENARWVGGHESAVRGNLLKDQNRYKEPEKLIELGRHLGIAHLVQPGGNRSFASLQKDHEALHAAGMRGRVSPGNFEVARGPMGGEVQAQIPHSHEGGDAHR